jgi:hypothetical protein
MRAAWVLFLIGCGFQSRGTDHPVDAGSDAGVPPDVGSVDLSPICPTIALGTPQFQATACATPTRALVRIPDSTSFDTEHGTSSPDNGLTCVRVPNGNTSLGNQEVCVLAAAQIIVPAGVVLSAHGSIPFALFARSIIIQGTVDVASHIGGPAGAGSLVSGCIPGKFATGGGGGRGGDALDHGGAGGDDSSTPMTGASGGGSFAVDNLSGGGCGGTRGGDGTTPIGNDGGNTTGGAGGGALWIVSLSGELVLDAGARINASGAGGLGAKIAGHGGAGGGAGGLIVLQAPTIHLDPTAVVFANGGHGGGGAGAHPDKVGFTVGADGSDPADPLSGGTGGTGGLDGDDAVGSPGGGAGGPGFPGASRSGQGATSDGHGGGGGGGGPGAIRVVSATDIAGTSASNVSPPPLLLQ